MFIPYTLIFLIVAARIMAREPRCALRMHRINVPGSQQTPFFPPPKSTSTTARLPPSSTPTPSPTPSGGLSQKKVAMAYANMKDVAYAPWEVGVAAEASTELLAPQLSVFNQGAFPPPAILNAGYSAGDVIQYATNAVNGKAPGSMTLSNDNGSVGDPASIGVAVLLANWTRANKVDQRFANAAGEELGYLLHVAPRTDAGAISHRSEFPAMWSDFVYMAPPFIAYFAILDNGGGGLYLLQEAYRQCRLYRDTLFDPFDRGGLWKHVLIGLFEDYSHWATGNAWAAAGMLRVRETIRHSSQAPLLVGEQRNLTTWIREIMDAVIPLQRPSGLVLNTLDASPYASFEDAAATALLASVAYRLAGIDGIQDYLPFADRALKGIDNNLGDDGWLRNVVDPYVFFRPGGHSPEAQAFVVLLQAAYRDHLRT